MFITSKISLAEVTTNVKKIVRDEESEAELSVVSGNLFNS